MAIDGATHVGYRQHTSLDDFKSHLTSAFIVAVFGLYLEVFWLCAIIILNPSIQKYSRMKDTFKFLFSLTFLKHLGLALFIAIALLFLVFFSLGLYTLHGRTMPVPDLVGLTEGQFDNLVVDLDLRYQIIDSVHLNNVTPGAVVEQTPKRVVK
jgi:hypothetical protein